MSNGTPMPSPFQTLLDGNGNPINAGRLFVYLAGTTTKTTTWSDAGLTTQNTNPVVADSSGRVTVFLAIGLAYKFVYALPGSDDPPSSPYKTVDNVLAIPSAANLDIDGTAGEDLSALACVFLSDGSGGFTAGRWYNTRDTVFYESTQPNRFGFVVQSATTTGNAVSIRVLGRVTGFGGVLTTGSYYYIDSSVGSITSTVKGRLVGIADTTSSLVIIPTVPYPDNTDILASNSTGGDFAIGDLLIRYDGITGWQKASSTLANVHGDGVLGFAVTTVFSGGGFGYVRIAGRVTGLVGLVTGSRYYVSDSAGLIATAPTGGARLVGVADSATSIVMVSQNVPNSQGQYAVVGNVNAVETVMMSSVVPAMIAGQSFTIFASGSIANNANNKTIRCYISGVPTLIDATITGFAAAAYTWQAVIKGVYSGALLYCTATISVSQAATAGAVYVGTANAALVPATTNIYFTGQSSVATNDVTQQTMTFKIDS